MTQEPASNDYKHLEREVKAVDFALALALNVAFALRIMTTGTH